MQECFYPTSSDKTHTNGHPCYVACAAGR